MSDITTVPFDYIVKHTKTENIVSQDEHGDYVCDIETEYIPLVRCKECVKRMREDCPMCNCCKLDRMPTEDDDYCSYGERKESE